MKKIEINEETKQNLLEEAENAQHLAHSPYSGIKVGAALLTKGGRIFTGANIENASYGLSMCAERVALFKAVSEGEREFTAMAIYSREVLPVPCGACLQVMSEFFNGDETVLIMGNKGLLFLSFKELLPYRFKMGE